MATATLARDLKNRERRARRAFRNAGYTLTKADGKYAVIGIVEENLNITAVERFAADLVVEGDQN